MGGQKFVYIVIERPQIAILGSKIDTFQMRILLCKSTIMPLSFRFVLTAIEEFQMRYFVESFLSRGIRNTLEVKRLDCKIFSIK